MRRSCRGAFLLEKRRILDGSAPTQARAPPGWNHGGRSREGGELALRQGLSSAGGRTPQVDARGGSRVEEGCSPAARGTCPDLRGDVREGERCIGKGPRSTRYAEAPLPGRKL